MVVNLQIVVRWLQIAEASANEPTCRSVLHDDLDDFNFETASRDNAIDTAGPRRHGRRDFCAPWKEGDKPMASGKAGKVVRAESWTDLRVSSFFLARS